MHLTTCIPTCDGTKDQILLAVRASYLVWMTFFQSISNMAFTMDRGSNFLISVNWRIVLRHVGNGALVAIKVMHYLGLGKCSLLALVSIGYILVLWMSIDIGTNELFQGVKNWDSWVNVWNNVCGGREIVGVIM